MGTDALAERIREALDDLRKFSDTDTGVTRLPFSPAATCAVSYLKERMHAVGLTVTEDATGAVHGRMGGKGSAIFIGSHYDSVACGGAFDGIAGVVCAIEVAKMLHENKIPLKHPVEIIATNDEEGVRFGAGFFTSTAMVEGFDADYLKNLCDNDGVTLYEAIGQFGLNPDSIAEAKLSDDAIKQFWEIHIEQGPVLFEQNIDLGIVDGIVAMKRFRCTVSGRADHAGTTPMDLRRDAMRDAAKTIDFLYSLPEKLPDYAVVTVGSISAVPNMVNVIASQVDFSIDMRCESDAGRDAMYRELRNFLDTNNMTYSLEQLLNVSAAQMDKSMGALIEEGCGKRQVGYIHMLSGAGHDSLVFAKKYPACMIFVPSTSGRSHCPEEHSKPEHLALATRLLYDAIVKTEGSVDNGLSK